MLKTSLLVSTITALTAIALLGSAQGAQQANLSGTYRCGPDAKSCQWSGTTFTVTQTGSNLDVKNEKNELGSGTVTSATTVSMGPPWNMLGLISGDSRQIDWSNGTQWRKQ